VREAHRVAQLEDLLVAEFDDPIARRAVEMIVRWIPIVMLVRASIGQSQLAQQPRLNEQA
jgi:hypothetical protein